jgi:hypothetical protein
MDDLEDQKQESLSELWDAGSEITGSVIGAGLGFAVAGPPGVVAGAAVAPVATRVIRAMVGEFAVRTLGQRERVRTASVARFAAERIQQRRQNGDEFRSDGFFDAEPGQRSTAEEVVEGVLLVAQREHEERKMEYLGNLLANLAYAPEIDRDNSNLLIRYAEALSYRQLRLISVLGRKEHFDLGDGPHRGTIPFATAAVLLDVFELYRRGLVFVEDGIGLSLEVAGLVPSRLIVRGSGVLLFNLMELYKIDISDLMPIAELLRAREHGV